MAGTGRVGQSAATDGTGDGDGASGLAERDAAHKEVGMLGDWTVRHFAAEDLITTGILAAALVAAVAWQAWEQWKNHS